MASKGIRPLPEFNPSESGAPEWEMYKRDFTIHLDALGLDDKPGRRKVGVLLSNMGRECVKIYDSFTWVEAVVEDRDRGIAAREAEDKYNLDTVFSKFDRHFGVHNYRNVKRQEFLNTKRGTLSIMDYIAELKRKAEHCQYGEQEEGFICDMIINGIGDKKCSEKLMEIPADQLRLDRVIETCRQVELTTAHLKTLGLETASVNMAHKHNKGKAPAGKGEERYCQMNVPFFCEKCCRNHQPRNCPAYHKTCDTCGQRGHFKASKVCKGKNVAKRGHYSHYRGAQHSRGQSYRPNRGSYRNVHHAEDEAPCDVGAMGDMFDTQASVSDVFTADIGEEKDSDWSVKFAVGKSILELEIDSGAACNVLSRATAEKLQSHNAKILRSNAVINGVSGQQIKAYGQITLPCMYKGTRRKLTFQVLDTIKNVNLLGRDDSVKLGLIMRVNSVKTETESLIKEFSDVLGEEIGCLPGQYTVKIDKSVQPVVHVPRPVPVAIREQVKQELDHLEKCNIIAQVKEPTEWVNSMVCVRKKNGRVRICIDPTDLNKAILREHYPMNTIEDVVTRLHGSKYFTTLDANMGYYQIKLSDESSDLMTFNTPFGRYKFLRMPMGAKCSSEVFQREMQTHFGTIDGAEVIVDDILVHGKTLKEHNERLRNVLQKARSINLKLNKAKCVFAKPEVDYVGHKLTGEGLKPTDQRIEAIVKMREPENQSELQTILGMLSYVSKFIPDLSELNAPLRDLKKQTEWNWTTEAQEAFKKIKTVLTSTKVLRYYDVKKPAILTVDASMRGLGAAIIQADGVVTYASRALSPAEQKYAQIEKEMLAVVFGCEKFHKLLYGKQDLTIESDHKPLENIMKKPIHTAPLRIQRMMLKLQPYEFTLIHRSGKDMGLADCLSRLPLNKVGEKAIDEELMVLKLETLSCSNHDKISEATQNDQHFQIVKQVVSSGWPTTKSEVPTEAMPFWDVRDELAVYNGVLYRGERVCIPAELRSETLKAIHKSHLGFVNCKKRAREIVYWPGMNSQIEELVSKCSACLTHRNKSQKEPMIIQPIPSLPWSKVGADLFEIEGNHYLIMVDYYSNFIEVAPLQHDTRTSTVVKQMKANIARYGIMDTLISDNGPQFASGEFKKFMSDYGINHVTSSPLHQQANGLAERAVQSIKNLIKKCFETGEDIYLGLLELRNTSRDDIGSPMQRLMGRRGKTLVPMSESLRKPDSVPDKTEKVTSKLLDYRHTQKYYYDQRTKAKDDIKPGDALRIQTPEGWKPAEYVRDTEYPRSHIVRAGKSGREYRRNTSMLMKTREKPHNIVAQQPEIPYIPPVPPVSQNNANDHQNRESARSVTANRESSRKVSANHENARKETVQSRENAQTNIRSGASERPTITPERLSSPANITNSAERSGDKREYRTRSGREIRKPRKLADYV